MDRVIMKYANWKADFNHILAELIQTESALYTLGYTNQPIERWVPIS